MKLHEDGMGLLFQFFSFFIIFLFIHMRNLRPEEDQ